MNLKYNYNVCKSKIIENLCRIISSLKLFSLVNTCLFKFPDNTFVIDVLAVPSLHIMLGMVDKMVTYIKGAIATCWWRHSWPQLTTPPSITRGRRAWRAMTAWRSWSISPASRPGSRHCPSGRLSMSEQPTRLLHWCGDLLLRQYNLGGLQDIHQDLLWTLQVWPMRGQEQTRFGADRDKPCSSVRIDLGLD